MKYNLFSWKHEENTTAKTHNVILLNVKRFQGTSIIVAKVPWDLIIER